MLHYADLDLSIIDELPPGRTPVGTKVISAERRDEIIARIEAWIAQGRQAYWVCPLIEESEVLQCEAAERTRDALAAQLPNRRIGLVHGRLRPAEKEAVMQAFKAGDIDLLVATTVIEVGVDVPNAGLMIIDNAERLGLAQLHQLRGRVGRGKGESYCLLLYQPPLSSLAKQRLSILRETHNGFVIAEKDLALRGPGELLGLRQTGPLAFKIADLEQDRSFFEQLPDIAQRIETTRPELIPALVERWLGTTPHFAEV